MQILLRTKFDLINFNFDRQVIIFTRYVCISKMQHYFHIILKEMGMIE